jgi:hypothetical protein
MSRTTKAFRQALLHKNATGLWKRVWENPEVEGIPERPEDLSIPAWTNLLFGTHCHVRIAFFPLIDGTAYLECAELPDL